MINPSQLIDAVVATLQTNAPLVGSMGDNAAAITAHHYLYGQDNRFAEMLAQMTPPAVLIAWEGTAGGNFNGQTIWKHHVCAYIRSANAANAGQFSYETIFWQMMNGFVNGSGLSMRRVQILPTVDLMETPNAIHMVDEDQMDFFKVEMVFPEIGDN